MILVMNYTSQVSWGPQRSSWSSLTPTLDLKLTRKYEWNDLTVCWAIFSQTSKTLGGELNLIKSWHHKDACLFLWFWCGNRQGLTQGHKVHRNSLIILCCRYTIVSNIVITGDEIMQRCRENKGNDRSPNIHVDKSFIWKSDRLLNSLNFIYTCTSCGYPVIPNHKGAPVQCTSNSWLCPCTLYTIQH